MREDGGAGQRFGAFLSYSHVNVREATRLHRRLEGFRLPRHLRQDRGNGAGRIGPIFRDREDLPAASDLSTSVRAALQTSSTLIVLCSPAARASPWVSREVQTFCELHPDRPVLAAILEGEPLAVMPEQLLLDREPLAADLRKEGDGRKLALLKIVAGIAEVPLDALIQRDAQRRLRRVIAITLASLIGMVAAAAMSIVAIQSRNEALAQRAQAESLVEFMLTDLRRQLKAVGRLDVMENVNRRAMTYYTDQGAAEDFSDDSLERRARIFGAMGEDAENAGNWGLAETRYRELYDTTAALLRQHPKDPLRTLAHARSENRLALLALSRGHRPEAEAGFRRTRTMLDGIGAWGRSQAAWIKLAGLVNGNICAVEVRRGLPGADTLADCERAVTLTRDLATELPENGGAAYDLVFHLIWLADAQSANGQADASYATRMQSLAASSALVARDPRNMLWREQQMEVFVRHAAWLGEVGHLKEEQAFLVRAGQLADDLVRRDPANATWSGYRDRIRRMIKGG
ncbi:toll/interleukin-1 receptor domain-containing protein [Novosphingobium beihaiensis]|uniref:Toll/interleukin-1 receptor domain-containing protein n=1 Tax=Novosphingobium beihaiensis TaxID=2930389 RepID=A0ABT0BSJ1_9SPHN|nr:toll/interleukin-1 receptor domain-containing protein [Novosphingobium beihaiensis]MCJ2188038.1 toll/interleukin-1 receptor domain-containing protein [Novosphingobium beihaiensis]